MKRIPSPAENCVFNNIIVTCSGIALMSSNILYKQEISSLGISIQPIFTEHMFA